MGGCIRKESARTTHLEATNKVANESTCEVMQLEGTEVSFDIHIANLKQRLHELLAENSQQRNDNMNITTEKELLKLDRDKVLADQSKISFVEEEKLTKDLKLKLQACVVGKVLKRNKKLIKTMQYFQIPIVYSSNGIEFIKPGDSFETIFILDNFEGHVFTCLLTADQRIFGPTAILQHYNTDILRKEQPTLPNRTRPTYTTSMENLVVTFSGFRSVEELQDMVDIVHHMGGRVRKEFCLTKTTHLVAKSNAVHGKKYKLAAVTNIPIMTVEWVQQTWARRRDVFCYATDEEMMQYKMLPFVGSVLAFVGYDNQDEQFMTDIYFVNGGQITDHRDPQCTHIIVEDGFRVNYSKFKKGVWILNDKWFWACVKMEVKVSEDGYKFRRKSSKKQAW